MDTSPESTHLYCRILFFLTQLMKGYQKNYKFTNKFRWLWNDFMRLMALFFVSVHSIVQLLQTSVASFRKKKQRQLPGKRISCLNCALKSRKLETLISYIFMTFFSIFPLYFSWHASLKFYYHWHKLNCKCWKGTILLKVNPMFS